MAAADPAPPEPCLITGATGRIGSQCLRRLQADPRRLQADGAVPMVLMRRPLPPGAWGELRVEEIPGDMEDVVAGAPPPALVAALQRARVVYHLAARVHLGGRGADQMARINAHGPAALFELARAAGVRRFVHVSTTGTIGCSAVPIPLDEGAPYNLDRFHNPYFDTKRAAEQEVLRAWRACPEPTDLIVVNPSIVIGPPASIRRMSRPRRRSGPRPGSPALRLVCFWFAGGVNLVDVRDVADAILQAARRGTPGQRYILAGQNVTVREFAELTARHFGTGRPRIRLPLGALRAAGGFAEVGERLTGRRARWNRTLAALAGWYWYYDAARAERELGFRARPLGETLRDLRASLSAAPEGRAWAGRGPARAGNSTHPAHTP